MSNREAAAASERPLPPLPEPRLWIIPGADGNGRESGFEDAMWHESGEFTKPLFTDEQMHAYVLADRAASAPQAVAAQPAALADIPDAELPGMWERADFMGGQDEAQAAASGVDALWVERAMHLAEVYAGEVANDYDPSEVRMDAAREALRAHLSTALTGAAKE